jgi:chitodextrinase
MTARRHALWLAAALLLASSTSWAAGPGGADRKPPTTPSNLRVTGVTAYAVSFAWGASTDNSGSLGYRLVNRSQGGQVAVPGTQTAFTWAASSFSPSQTYSFQVYAVDAAGNWSSASNTVSATLLRDTTAPQTPQLSLADAGPTHLSVSWTVQDDDPSPRYMVYLDGSLFSAAGASPSAVVALLSPETSHTFTVQARDEGGNLSPMSAPLTASTEAIDPSDHTPPTPPPNFWGTVVESCEVMLFWGASSDAVTPAQFIRYDISVNGTHIDSTSLGYTQVFEYGIESGPSHFEVVAIDEAGNVSAPVGDTFDLVGCVTFSVAGAPVATSQGRWFD